MINYGDYNIDDWVIFNRHGAILRGKIVNISGPLKDPDFCIHVYPLDKVNGTRIVAECDIKKRTTLKEIMIYNLHYEPLF